MKKVSIIMGIYNCEKTLTDAIDSVLAQTYPHWELVMCDDGSKDSTFTIASEYQKKFPDKIILLRNEKNMRLAATLNKCLSIASGEYIARMDADDLNLPNRLERQAYFLDGHPEIACVGCNMTVFDENGEHGQRILPEITNPNILLKTTFFAHPTIMMRKTVYSSLGGYTVSEKTMRAEDLDLWFRFSKAGYKGYNLQESLYQYRECQSELSKRTLKAAIQTSRVFLDGYKLLGFSKTKYVYALRPIIIALLPNSFIYNHHSGIQKLG